MNKASGGPVRPQHHDPDHGKSNYVRPHGYWRSDSFQLFLDGALGPSDAYEMQPNHVSEPKKRKT